jgi:hypothetical protein
LKDPEELDTEDPLVFAKAMLEAKTRFHLKMLGGCCGTDHRHLARSLRVLLLSLSLCACGGSSSETPFPQSAKDLPVARGKKVHAATLGSNGLPGTEPPSSVNSLPNNGLMDPFADEPPPASSSAPPAF